MLHFRILCTLICSRHKKETYTLGGVGKGLGGCQHNSQTPPPPSHTHTHTQYCGVDIFPIKKLSKFSAVINVQAILGSTHWRCSGKKGVLKNSCTEIRKTAR